MNNEGEEKSIDDLKRANKILLRYKEVQYKKAQYFKSKVEKRTLKF